LFKKLDRGGRDGRRVQAILYSKLGKDVTGEMKNYAVNSKVCRRRKLFESFLFSNEGAVGTLKACQCCDLCARLCSCKDSLD